MKKKLIYFILVVVALAIGGVVYLFNLKFTDAKKEQAAFSVEAKSFLDEFVKDNAAANKKYTEKIVVVSGKVTATELADSAVNIKMEDTLTGNYIIFAFQNQYIREAKQIKEGDDVSIKGSCSGGIFSEILESVSISFKRSTLMKKEN